MKRGRGGRGRGKRRGYGKHGANRELEYKEEGEEYGQIKKKLGSMRMSVYCFDGVTRIGKVRGSMSRVRFHPDMIVLVSLREGEGDKCDIIYLYRPEEAKTLKASGEIPQETLISENMAPELEINFDDDEEEKAEKAKPKVKSNLENFMPNSESSEEENEEEEAEEEEEEEEKEEKKKPEPKKEAPKAPAPVPPKNSGNDKKNAKKNDKGKGKGSDSEESEDELADI